MKIVIYSVLFLVVSFILSRFVICRMRWRDRRAYRVFGRRNILLKIADRYVDGHRIHYIIAGNENLPTLVFIHGSPGSWYRFKMFLLDKELLGKFRMISIDRPGFGFSDFGRPTHLQDQSEWIMVLLRELKTEQPMFLFGHSYGAPVAANLAVIDSGLFRKILIVSGAIDPALEKKELWRLLMAHKPLFWLIPGSYQPSNTELLFLKKDLEILAPDLHRVTCSVKFVHGEKDRVVPPGNIAYGQKMMVNAASVSVDIVKGAKHGVHRQKTKEVKKILMELE